MGIFKYILYFLLIIVFLVSGLGIIRHHDLVTCLVIERVIDVEGEENSKEDNSNSSEHEFTLNGSASYLVSCLVCSKISSSLILHENSLGFSIWQPPESEG